jgi:tRNA(fMet)-specific endonuclease VapC
MGLTPPFIDGQIASIAAVNKLTLITFNTKDFKHFQDLSVVDWRL